MASIFDGINVNPFDTSAQASAQRESTARAALQQGMRMIESRNFDGALRAFRQAIAFSSQDDTVSRSYNFIANIALRQDKPDEAIKAYQAILTRDRNNQDARQQLAKVYFSEERYAEAVKEYETLARQNPTAPNRYSLGQALLKAGRYDDALAEFNQVMRMAPTSGTGYFGAGQALSKLGRKEEAQAQLEKALILQPKLSEARIELGYVLADLHLEDEFNAQLEDIGQTDSAAALLLQDYFASVAAPEFDFEDTTRSSFNTSLGANSTLSAINAYLATANASMTLNVVIQFSKDMDENSVANVMNWRISRSDSYIGGKYNDGLPVSASEAEIAPIPISVIYNAETRQASVNFTLVQNGTSNATIDPSRIVFKFLGEDANGVAMNEEADEYSGATGPR
jgi:Flp pilus assembly protein TadD